MENSQISLENSQFGLEIQHFLKNRLLQVVSRRYSRTAFEQSANLWVCLRTRRRTRSRRTGWERTSGTRRRRTGWKRTRRRTMKRRRRTSSRTRSRRTSSRRTSSRRT
ncbi:unnamed protein product, partial [Nesidiocoris tenuis]